MAWFTIEQAALYAHMAEATIRQLVQSGQLPAYRKPNSSRYIIASDDIDDYIKSNCERFVPEKIDLLRKAGVA